MIRNEDLTPRMRRVLEYGNDPLNPEAQEALKEVWQNGDVKPFLEKILEDEGALGEIGERSFQHGNGFDRFVVFQPGEQNQPALRIHLWKTSGYNGKPHQHDWDFTSVCLFGGTQQEIYEESVKGDVSVRKYVLHATYGAGHKKEFLAETDLSCVKRELFTPGNTFSLDNTQIHTFGATKAPTATLVLRGLNLPKRTLIYDPSGLIEEISRQHKFFSAEEVRTGLKEVYANLPN